MDMIKRTVCVNHLRMNVAFAGENNTGPWVLLVHGFPDDHTVWRHQVPLLVERGFRVIAPDTRGCGESEIPQGRAQFHLDCLVSDLTDLLDQFGVPTVQLVGHDWGAVIGWHFAIKHPERIERYLALSVGHPYCYARGGPRQMLKAWYVLFIQLRSVAVWLMRLGDWWMLRKFADFASEWPHVQARLSRPGRLMAGMNYYIANIGMLFSSPSPVKVPVMGIWSDGDTFLVERQMTESSRFATRGWSYAKLPGANHWLQLDKPEQLNRLLDEFLGSTPAAEH